MDLEFEGERPPKDLRVLLDRADLKQLNSLGNVEIDKVMLVCESDLSAEPWAEVYEGGITIFFDEKRVHALAQVALTANDHVPDGSEPAVVIPPENITLHNEGEGYFRNVGMRAASNIIVGLKAWP